MSTVIDKIEEKKMALKILLLNGCWVPFDVFQTTRKFLIRYFDQHGFRPAAPPFGNGENEVTSFELTPQFLGFIGQLWTECFFFNMQGEKNCKSLEEFLNRYSWVG
jgi:hypothetical protein